jgi:Mn2+/Fe2+ NRAMP family transporter
MSTSPPRTSGVLTGAAFLMAVSAIGPGFLTQTTTFTARLGASLAFAILLSILIDIGAQMNTWRVICISRKRGHEVVNEVIPGFGWVLTAIIIVGSFVFNLGNFAGCALGLLVLLNLDLIAGACLSAAIGVAMFMLPQMLKGMDWFAKVLGAGMILMTFYVVFATMPPLGEAARQAVWPDTIEIGPIVTLIGGTIGGYIMFSGAHRLLDGGVGGPENARQISQASVQGIIITGVMRAVLFLAVLGVVETGVMLSSDRPVFDAFEHGAGQAGYILSGLIFWSAAITSVVGCSYTAVSFAGLKPQSRAQAVSIIGFILLSLAATVALQLADVSSTEVLIAAGTINGVLLPLFFGVILVAGMMPRVMGTYKQPRWILIFGWLAWLVTLYFAYYMADQAVRRWFL